MEAVASRVIGGLPNSLEVSLRKSKTVRQRTVPSAVRGNGPTSSDKSDSTESPWVTFSEETLRRISEDRQVQQAFSRRSADIQQTFSRVTSSPWPRPASSPASSSSPWPRVSSSAWPRETALASSRQEASTEETEQPEAGVSRAEATPADVTRQPAAQVSTNFGWSPADREIANGRLAMVGLIAALWVEHVSGLPISEHLNPSIAGLLPSIILPCAITGVLFTSFQDPHPTAGVPVPVRAAPSTNFSVGFTDYVERINGCGAMMLFITLLCAEAATGTPVLLGTPADVLVGLATPWLALGF